MQNRDKIAEWVKNPKMEASWGSKNEWYLFEEYCNKYKYNGMFFLNDGFEIRKRKNPIEDFKEDLRKLEFPFCLNDINGFLDKIGVLAEKHFGDNIL